MPRNIRGVRPATLLIYDLKNSISCLKLMTLKIINEGLLVMAVNNDENEVSSKKTLLQCKPHTLFMAKTAKIDNLFMSNTTSFSVQVKRDIAILRA